MKVFDPPGSWLDVQHLAFGPDGHWLVAAFWGYGLAAFHTVNTDSPNTHAVRTSGPYGVLIHPSGKWCWFPAGYDGLVRLSFPDLKLSTPNKPPSSEHVGGAWLSRDGRHLLYRRFPADNPQGSQEVVGYTLSTDDIIPRWTIRNSEWGRFAVDFLPDGDRFVSVEYQSPDRVSRFAIHLLSSGQLERTFSCHGKEIRSVTVSPNGAVLVGQSGHSVWIWNEPHWNKKPRKLKTDNKKHFTGVAFHPSGKYLAATSNDATVKLYDTTTWEVARTFTWNVGKMLSIAFSPDGTLAAAGSDKGKVVVWDVDF